MILKLICNETQEVKEAPQGYFWTFLLCGGFTPLYRKDTKRGILFLVIAILPVSILLLLDIQIHRNYPIRLYPTIIYALYAFVYNKRYTQELLNKGYVGYDKESIEYLEEHYELKNEA